MKPVEQEYFYKKYLHLLDDADEVSPLEKVDSEMDTIIEQSKSLGFLTHFYPILFLLVIPLVILSCIIYIKEGWSYKLVPVLMAILFFVYKRAHLATLVADLVKPQANQAPKDQLASKFAYALQGIETKLYRIDFIQQLYYVFFPWILFLLADLLFGPYSTVASIVWIVIAYVLSTIAWFTYFSKEKQSIHPTIQQIESLRNIYYKI